MQEPSTHRHRDQPRDFGLSIYDSLENHPQLFLPAPHLEARLKQKLRGLKLDQPIRTRSKVLRTAVCGALGYPVPQSFLKTRPRFPGQNFDVYAQKSDNLQIWNEELDASRRYVLVKVNADDLVSTVRVISGAELAKLDTTGTLTGKHQAKAIEEVTSSRLVSATDTPDLMKLMRENKDPFYRQLKPINLVFEELRKLSGTLIENPGDDQERNRGWALHQLVSQRLGIDKPKDAGQLPDVREQLLELKLQTSPTIDLGLIRPGSIEALESISKVKFADIRYAVFYATPVGNRIRIDHVVVSTGADFFCFFKQLQGNVVNKKNQIRLPTGFFDETR